MEDEVFNEKNQKIVRVLSWIIIALSMFFFLRSIFGVFFYSTVIKVISLPENINHSIGINFTVYLIENAIKIVLCAALTISAIFVLKYKNIGRKALIYGLILAIIYLMAYPLINYYNLPSITSISNKGMEKGIGDAAKVLFMLWSYAVSIILSGFFAFVIRKLSKPEIKLLFK